MRLTTPLDERTVRELELGQEIFLSGKAFTARDEAHLRFIERSHAGQTIPFSLKGSVVYHCGPIMRKDDGWHLVAAGPTTSARMNDMEPDFIRLSGVRAIIGKGGMSRPTAEAMKEVGCVYLAFTGGAAAIASKGVKNVNGVHWLDLGMPEAVWELELEGFGPLIVAMDAHGHSLYDEVRERTDKNLERLRRSL